MGREIRMVPPNWEHPKKADGRYQPMFNRTFKEASKEWLDGLKEWEASNRSATDDCEYWEWHGDPPDREYYLPEWDAEPTWYQVYETVSEGTPVTPPFATKEDLIDYLVKHGDFWYQSDISEKGYSNFRSIPSREAAVAFVEGGSAPSLIITNDNTGISIKEGYQCLNKTAQQGEENAGGACPR